ncbi:MAG: DUF4255 domain-containing protein [Armatimonadetes bacterium]|nr:DUF4255 domain-containing protein [Armatimonadota bacterium]
MIHDVDASLTKMLLADLVKTPELGIRSEDQITFVPPTNYENDPPKKTTINLYLHDVRENRRRREAVQDRRQRNDNESATLRRAPLHLDMSYLISVHSPEGAAVEHRLLTELIGIFMRSPMMPVGFMGEDLAVSCEESLMLSIAQADHPSQENPAALWQALGGRLRPTLGLIVTGSFNPFEARVVRLVREAMMGIGQGVPPHGPKRPLDMRGTRVTAAGIVSRPDGTPVLGAEVSVKGRGASTRTDDRGFFFFLDLPAGRHTLNVRSPGFHLAEVVTHAPPLGRPDQLEPLGIVLTAQNDLEALESEVAALPDRYELRHEPAEMRISLAGRLVREDGRPQAFTEVWAGDRVTQTDGEGYYAFFNLRSVPGTIRVRVPGRDDLELPAGGAKTVVAATAKKSK